MKRSHLGIIIMISLITLLFTGCGLYGPEETMEIDPPPTALEDQVDADVTLEITDLNMEQTNTDQLNTELTVEQDVKLVKLTIYYFDENGDVVPLTMDIPKVEGIGQQVLNYMTIGGPAEELLPAGFRPVLPEGTKFTMNVKADEKLAVVDFSKEFLSYDAKSEAEEKKILDAITWSLTEFPTIDQVEIRVNGYVLEAMPVWNTPIIGPLTRSDGINLELANHLQIGNTDSVTLYFNRATQNFDYLVPVTRVIPKTENLAEATLEQLILGPRSGSQLTSPILPTTKVLKVEVSDQLLVADFDEELLGFNQQLSQEVIDMIVWSLSENIQASSIQIKVKGETAILPEQAAKPIIRPQFINATIF